MQAFDQCLTNPNRPFICVMGGKKLSTKLPLTRSLLLHLDKLVIGGAMAFTFLQSLGIPIGKSLAEESCLHEARSILQDAKARGITVLLPRDVLCAETHLSPNPDSKLGDDIFVALLDLEHGIPPNSAGFDIGPLTQRDIRKELDIEFGTILWNGPLGLYEVESFSEGTFKIIDLLRDLTEKGGVRTFLCGGDTVSSVEQHLHSNDKASLTVSEGGHSHMHEKNCKEYFTHMSIAGGAALQYLANPANMPGLLSISYVKEIPDDLRHEDTIETCSEIVRQCVAPKL